MRTIIIPVIGAALALTWSAPAASQNSSATNAAEPVAANAMAPADNAVAPAPPATEATTPAAPADAVANDAAPASSPRSFPWGILGVLGLLGLIGARRRAS